MIACVKAASFINFCVFLIRGHYAFIVERLIGARAMYPHRQLLEQVPMHLADYYRKLGVIMTCKHIISLTKLLKCGMFYLTTLYMWSLLNGVQSR